MIEKPLDDKRADVVLFSPKMHSSLLVREVPRHVNVAFVVVFIAPCRRCPARGKPCQVCKDWGICKIKKTNVQAIQPEQSTEFVTVSAREKDFAGVASDDDEEEKTQSVAFYSTQALQIDSLDGVTVESTWKLRVIKRRANQFQARHWNSGQNIAALSVSSIAATPTLASRFNPLVCILRKGVSGCWRSVRLRR